MTFNPLAFAPAEPWQAEAACRDQDPEIFFPDLRDKREAEEAKNICYRCPVLAACRRWIADLEAREGRQFGIYAGLAEEERFPEDRMCRVPGCPSKVRSHRARYCADHADESRKRSKVAYDQRRLTA